MDRRDCEGVPDQLSEWACRLVSLAHSAEN